MWFQPTLTKNLRRVKQLSFYNTKLFYLFLLDALRCFTPLTFYASGVLYGPGCFYKIYYQNFIPNFFKKFKKFLIRKYAVLLVTNLTKSFMYWCIRALCLMLLLVDNRQYHHSLITANNVSFMLGPTAYDLATVLVIPHPLIKLTYAIFILFLLNLLLTLPMNTAHIYILRHNYFYVTKNFFVFPLLNLFYFRVRTL